MPHPIATPDHRTFPERSELTLYLCAIRGNTLTDSLASSVAVGAEDPEQVDHLVAFASGRPEGPGVGFG